MSRVRFGRSLLAASFILSLLVFAGGASRTWTDASGKFKIAAELIEVKDGKVQLRKDDGEEIAVPLKRLSEKDRAYLEEQGDVAPTDKEAEKEARKSIKGMAEMFFEDLRTEERTEAKGTLTTEAQKLAQEGQSPLAGLPQPDKSSRSILVSRVKIKGNTAEAPVRVRAGGASHKTKLHFRKEGSDWRIFAISAEFPDGEKTINFEASVAAGGGADQQLPDPLLGLVGKPLEVEGFTLEGQPLDLSAFEGKVVLIDFWATWCGPCLAEIPNILKNYQKFHDQGFEVVAISVDRDLEALNQFLAEEQPPWTVLADNHPKNQASMAQSLDIRGIPAFVLLGKDGSVAAVNCRGKLLEQELTKLLGKPADLVAERTERGATQR